MRPIYAVYNEEEKEKFEKATHLAYGYALAQLYTDPLEAVKQVETSRKGLRDKLVVEEIISGKAEIYYRGFWYSPELDNPNETDPTLN